MIRRDEGGRGVSLLVDRSLRLLLEGVSVGYKGVYESGMKLLLMGHERVLARGIKGVVSKGYDAAYGRSMGDMRLLLKRDMGVFFLTASKVFCAVQRVRFNWDFDTGKWV